MSQHLISWLFVVSVLIVSGLIVQLVHTAKFSQVIEKINENEHESRQPSALSPIVLVNTCFLLPLLLIAFLLEISIPHPNSILDIGALKSIFMLMLIATYFGYYSATSNRRSACWLHLLCLACYLLSQAFALEFRGHPRECTHPVQNERIITQLIALVDTETKLIGVECSYFNEKYAAAIDRVWGHNVVSYNESTLEKLSEGEVTALLVHEVGHVIGRDSTAQVFVNAIQAVGLTLLFIVVAQRRTEPSYSRDIQVARRVAKALLIVVFLWCVGLFTSKSSESAADAFAVSKGAGSSLAAALEKLDPLAIPTFHASLDHLDLQTRIAVLRRPTQ
jgi:Zn-dependent protease with chaperone function